MSLKSVATLLYISSQSSHRPRKVQTMIRPTYSQTKTSSQSASDASVSRKSCSGQMSLRKNPAESTTLLSLYADVMLSSGTFVFPEIVERMTRELTASTPLTLKIQVVAPPELFI